MNLGDYRNSHARIETPRLRLRKFDVGDASDVFEYTSDPEVARYEYWEAYQDEDQVQEFIEAQQLLARVFSIDCGGQMKIIAALTDRASIRTYLEGVGLTARPPPIAQARPSQQSEFEYAA